LPVEIFLNIEFLTGADRAFLYRRIITEFLDAGFEFEFAPGTAAMTLSCFGRYPTRKVELAFAARAGKLHRGSPRFFISTRHKDSAAESPHPLLAATPLML